jgi:hypothetical protein
LAPATVVLLAAGCADEPREADPFADLPPAPASTYQGPRVVLKFVRPPGTWELTLAGYTCWIDSVDGQEETLRGGWDWCTFRREIGRPDPDGLQDFRITYRRIWYVGAYPSGVYSFDTAAPTSEQNRSMAAHFAPYTNLDARLVLDRDGYVKRVRGVRPLLDAAERRAPPYNPATEWSVARTTLRWMAGTDAAALPGTPVGPGDSWTVRREDEYVGALGQVDYTEHFRVVDIEDTPAGLVAVVDAAAHFLQFDPPTSGDVEVRCLERRQWSRIRVDVRTGMWLKERGRSVTTIEKVERDEGRPRLRTERSTRHWRHTLRQVGGPPGE